MRIYSIPIFDQLIDRWGRLRRPYRIAITAAVVVVLSMIAYGATLALVQTGGKIDKMTKVVTFYVDGKEKTILTRADKIADAIKDAEIKIYSNDYVDPHPDTKIDNNVAVVNIRRARPIVVSDSLGRRTIISTASNDKGEIARAAGMDIKSRDTVELSQSKNTIANGAVGQEVKITRAKTVNLVLYGQSMTLHSQKATVGEVLGEYNIKLAKDDTMTVKKDEPVVDGMNFRIWRNGLQTIEQDEDIPFEIEVRKDSTKKVGYHEIQTAGQNGKRKVIYQVRMQDGVEVERKKISEVETTTPVKQIEIEGSKIEMPPGSHTDWMAMAGIPESDYGATNYIISRESGWRYNAANPSGAYGLPQALPGSKMASAGSDWQTNPITQLRWFYSYCVGRYGSVQGAYNFWVSHHWY